MLIELIILLEFLLTFFDFKFYKFFNLADSSLLTKSVPKNKQKKFDSTILQNYLLSNKSDSDDTFLIHNVLGEKFTTTNKQMIYPSSDIYLNDYIISLKPIIINHKLSDNAVNDLCKFIQLILPKPNKVPSNSKILNTKYFYNSEDLSLYHVHTAKSQKRS